MPRLCQNDREQGVGMVQTGMTHQAIADHFNVSRITISRLMIRLRQTGRMNDRPCSGRLRHNVKTDIYALFTSLITVEDTACRKPDLPNVWISDQTVCRRLRESGLRARCPVVGPILKQCHRTARLAWARACRRWRLHTPGNTSFLVMNPDFHFVLAMDVIVCTAGVGNVLRTSVCTSPTVLGAEVLWSELEFVMMVALSSHLFMEHWMP
jgi:hypothetical protein